MAWGQTLSAHRELALAARSALLTGVIVGTDQVIFPSFFVVTYDIY